MPRQKPTSPAACAPLAAHTRRCRRSPLEHISIAPAAPSGTGFLRCALDDRRGAVALLAVFMGIFATGTLFYVLGLADAVAQRSAMQDAADATAFAAAVVHAKAMNAVVLCNVVMAALLSVLVALRLVTTIALAVAGIAAAMSFLNPGFAAVIPAASLTAQKADKAYHTAKTFVDPALEAVQTVSDGLARVMPGVAVLRAMEQGSQNHAPRVTAAGAVPESLSLPVRRGSPALLCEKAGEFAGTLVTIPLKSLPLGGQVSDLTSGLLAELAAAAPGWFCGIHGGKPVRHTREQRVRLPQMADDRACLEANDTAACERMADSLRRADPDPDTGDCQTDCDADGAYAARAGAARLQCKPGAAHSLRNYSYQVQRIRRTEVRNNNRWEQEGPTTVLQVHLRSSPRAPCTVGSGRFQRTWQRWDDNPGTAEEPRPVCLAKEPNRRITGGNANRRVVTVEAVSRILACEEIRTVDVTPAGMEDDTGGGAAQPKTAPKELVADVVHGGRPFQLRALALGRGADPLPQRILEVAGRGRSNAIWDEARRAGQVGVAQAEYHFDGELNRDAMWQTGWTARLTRLHFSGDGDGAGVMDELQTGPLAACGELPVCRALQHPSVDEWMVH